MEQLKTILKMLILFPLVKSECNKMEGCENRAYRIDAHIIASSTFYFSFSFATWLKKAWGQPYKIKVSNGCDTVFEKRTISLIF